MTSKPFFATFPGTQLWILSALTLNIVRLPFWLLYYIPSTTRPCPNWSYTQALRVRLMKAFIKSAGTTQSGTLSSLLPGKEGPRFLTIHPALSSRYQGVAASDPDIKPAVLGGTWYPERPSASDGPVDGDVTIHFHGRAHVIGDGRTDDAGFAAKTMIAQTTVSHGFCPQYRLSIDHTGRFPAALQDAITSLCYLTESLQISATSVAISGGSAGGNLTPALLRYIHDNPASGVPDPSCAFLWSPWVDLARTLVTDSFEHSPRSRTDYLTPEFGVWGAKGLTPYPVTG